MTTTYTRTITLDDGATLTLAVEQPDTDRAVARMAYAGRTFEIVAARDEGLDGEPATWHADVAELAGGSGSIEQPFGWEATNLGFASADAALEETIQHIVQTVTHDAPRD